jgi:putative glutamine amidotransferase
MRQLDLNIKKRPVIGIPTDIIEKDFAKRHWLRDSYVSAVIAAGGAPMLIPSTPDDEVLYSLYRGLDGLLLSGGADIDPKYYNEAVAGTESDEIIPERDTAELRLAGWALEDNLPVLGICRGHQVLNVALGGSLIQDIPSSLPASELDHRGSTHTSDRGLLCHAVSIEAGCKLAGIFETTRFMVNSLHHQGVKRLGTGLRGVGVTDDGLVEALESEQHRWVVSIQWHPEELWQKQPSAANLFRAFVEAAAVRQNELALVHA